jgi:hypothetical protein
MHAVGQAHRLRQVVVVELERRRGGGVEHLESVRQDLDLAARRGWRSRCRPAGARTLPVTRRQYSLRTLSAVAKVSARSGSQTTCTRPSRSLQVDEDDATVVATAMGPAEQGHGLVEVGGVDPPGSIRYAWGGLYDGSEGSCRPPAAGRSGDDTDAR